MLKDVTLLRSERPQIRNDPPPPRLKHNKSAVSKQVMEMRRGSWQQVTHARAKWIHRIIRDMGGSATVYKTSDLFSVVLVLEAPWMAGLDEVPATQATC